MPEASRRLFVITASNEEAKQHVQKTIANPIDPAICAAHFPADVLDQVSRKSTDGNFYAWGARPGKRNEPNWNALQEGDYVFLYQDGTYTYWTRVISKYRNRVFAEAVWGKHPEGDTWEFMYFLQPSAPLCCPARPLADSLPAQYQGFTPISAEKAQNIVSKHGSIEKFIEQRMAGTGIYLLLRSNEGSGWSDKEGHSYHYGNTVANHTAVARGAKLLLDRVDRDARRIFGTGIIGPISEEPGSGKATKTFRAAYEQYRPLRPPRLVTKEEESLLTALSGYNIQHSIHRITAEVFEKLGKPATAWIFQANPTLYNLRGALQALSVDTFLVTRYEDEIKTGDRVYLWESGKEAGIVGIADVIEDPKSRPEEPESLRFQLDPAKLGGTRVRALLRRVRIVDPPISREQIQSLPAFSNLSILRQAFASNFKVTPAEAEAIEDLLEQKTEPGRNSTSERVGVNENNELPKKLILCGPPGTGKTYHTVDKALEVLDSKYFADHKDNRENLKRRFDEHARAGRIEFVTFHQSFSYEDFVEGIRAETTPEGQIRYDVQDGVFKDLCDRARRATAQGGDLGISESPRIWKISIDRAGPSAVRDYCLNNGEARIGWQDVGDLRSLEGEGNSEFRNLGPNDRSSLMAFYEEIRVGDVLLCIKSATEVQAIGVVTGNYDFSRNEATSAMAEFPHVRPVHWLVKDLSLTLESLNDGKAFTQKTVYELRRFTWDQLVQLLNTKGHSIGSAHGEKPRFVIIIDEINRGNISRIFGELITLIEPSKREGADEALEVRLPYSKLRFSVPANIYLIGTMNTADRSLTGMDIALRRRFKFEEIPPQSDLLTGVIVEGLDIRALLMTLNERIEVMLDRDHCLGHSYFLPLKTDGSLKQLAHIFEREIIPLLREYFFEDSERIRWVLNDHRKPAEHQFLLKPQSDLVKLFGEDPGMPTETRRLVLNADAFSRIESFRGIVDAQ